MTKCVQGGPNKQPASKPGRLSSCCGQLPGNQALAGVLVNTNVHILNAWSHLQLRPSFCLEYSALVVEAADKRGKTADADPTTGCSRYAYKLRHSMRISKAKGGAL